MKKKGKNGQGFEHQSGEKVKMVINGPEFTWKSIGKFLPRTWVGFIESKTMEVETFLPPCGKPNGTGTQ